jgi:hypothetical protein
MLRREVVKMTGSLFGLGAGTPSRFPYTDRPQSGPGIGAGQGQNVRARIIIISGAGGGLFVYSGTPAPGNPPIAYIAAAGVTKDPYGNTLPNSDGGVVSSNNLAHLFSALLGGQVVFGNSADPLPAPSIISETGGGSFGASLTIESGQGNTATVSGNLFLQDDQSAGTAGTGRVSVVNAAFKSVGGSPAAPTLVTTDTWQPITSFSNGWAANGQCRVKLLPDGYVKLQLNATAGTLADGTTICQVPTPATYQPNAASQFLDAQTRGGTAMVNGPGVQVTTGGNVQAESLPTNTTSIRVNGDYALD